MTLTLLGDGLIELELPSPLFLSLGAFFRSFAAAATEPDAEPCDELFSIFLASVFRALTDIFQLLNE